MARVRVGADLEDPYQLAFATALNAAADAAERELTAAGVSENLTYRVKRAVVHAAASSYRPPPPEERREPVATETEERTAA